MEAGVRFLLLVRLVEQNKDKVYPCVATRRKRKKQSKLVERKRK